jgi:hypothetical protein
MQQHALLIDPTHPIERFQPDSKAAHVAAHERAKARAERPAREPADARREAAEAIGRLPEVDRTLLAALPSVEQGAAAAGLPLEYARFRIYRALAWLRDSD